MKRRYRFYVLFFCGAFLINIGEAGFLAAGEKETKESVVSPIIGRPESWNFNNYWQPRIIGPKAFYMADYGLYMRLSPQDSEKLRQVGLSDLLIPGFVDSRFQKFLLKANRSKADNHIRELFNQIIDEGWPIYTASLSRTQGNPPVSADIAAEVNEQWIGDGMPETIYRLEPVLNYLRSGGFWSGSSMEQWKKEVFLTFLQQELVPALEKKLPFVREPTHKWTRPELRTLCDIYTEEFIKPVKRPIVFGMMLSSYYLASKEQVLTVAEKAVNSFSCARARGLMRQFGGNKFFLIWLGHEPIEKYGYFEDASFTERGDQWGLPLPHIWYYIYRPYLVGANYYVNEKIPIICIQDIEDDKQYECSTIGHIVKDMMNFVERHPDRGIVYSPVALLLDYNREFSKNGTTYLGYNLPNDDADYMNASLVELLFPEHRHVEGSGQYSGTAPFGEIFDILKPDEPNRMIDINALANYKILFALGGMNFNEEHCARFKDYVEKGGTIVLNAADVTKYLDEDFIGFSPVGTKKLCSGSRVRCGLCGYVSTEPNYYLHSAKVKSAEVLFADDNNQPIVLKNSYGKGRVITLLPDYMIQKDEQIIHRALGAIYPAKALLNFSEHFLTHLISGVMPIEVRRADEDSGNLTWIISKKDDGWLVSIFNYSLARESIVPEVLGTGKVLDKYPLKETPFEVVCHTPVEDVIELYHDRDVKWQKVNGEAVISETIHGGEIRVYELQPHKIDFPYRQRYINYAANQPVIASSYRKPFGPERAVEGEISFDSYWWSDSNSEKNIFEMPQWIQVYLGGLREIDHIFLQFYDDSESLQTRLSIYKFVVQVSTDALKWKTVIDESRNEDAVRTEGFERWFTPVSAKYVRLVVYHNSALGGVRLVEMKVMGKEREKYLPQRKKIEGSKLAVVQQYPEWVNLLPDNSFRRLIDMPVEDFKAGWLPPGKDWHEMNGNASLKTSLSGEGKLFGNSIYAQCPSELTYRLNKEYKTFLANIGIGNHTFRGKVEFRVYLDGRLSYLSPVYSVGMPILSVVVDVSNAAEMKLVVDGTEDAGQSYPWWADAKLVKKQY